MTKNGALMKAREEEPPLRIHVLPEWPAAPRQPAIIPDDAVLEIAARHLVAVSVQCGVVRVRGEELQLNSFAQDLYDLGSAAGRFSCTWIEPGRREWVWCAT